MDIDLTIPGGGILLLLLVIGIVAVLYAIFGGIDKKKDLRKGVTFFGIVFIALSLFGGNFMGDDIPVQPAPSPYEEPTSPDTTKLISTLTSQFRDKATGSWATVSGSLKMYQYGENPAAANILSTANTTITAGSGSTGIDNKMYSGRKYGLYFDGSGTYYDVKYPVDTISGASTTASSTTALIQFMGIEKVGTWKDPIEEDATDGTINGQTTSTNNSAGGNEINIAATGSPADGDRMYYNVTNSDGVFYLQYEISNTVANTFLKNPVLVFVSDNSNPFPSNGITAIWNSPVSGSLSGFESDLLDEWTNDMAVTINKGESLSASWSSINKMTFTYNEGTLTAGDRMYIYLDDMGNHLGKDILLNKKASPVTIADITIA